MKNFPFSCTKNSDELDKILEKKEEKRKIRKKHKLIRKKNKATEKETLNEIKKKQQWFHFFTKWFFLGIIFVILSICISFYAEILGESSANVLLKNILSVVSGVLSTIGISLFVGCVFDFSKNSDAFMEFVSKILSDIVVSKNFLSSLSIKDKEQALNLILRPEASQIEQYANINEFFKKKIRESMTMFDANFKTNLTINVEAHKDTDKKIVYCKTTFTYTVYKLNDKFAPLETIFEKEDSLSETIKIISPDGKVELKEDRKEEVMIAGLKCTKSVLMIPEQYEKYDHLTVKKTIKEPGHDHWINYIWQSLTPYEGVTCSIKCFDDLKIKDFMIFDNKSYYHVDKSTDNTAMEITSSQWLDSDTGFSIVISE